MDQLTDRQINRYKRQNIQTSRRSNREFDLFIVQNLFGTQDLFIFDSGCVFASLIDETDPWWQDAALFKAAWFQQEQTCCIPFIMQQRNWFSCLRNGWEWGWPWFIFCRYQLMVVTNWLLLTADKSVRTFWTWGTTTYHHWVNQCQYHMWTDAPIDSYCEIETR